MNNYADLARNETPFLVAIGKASSAEKRSFLLSDKAFYYKMGLINKNDRIPLESIVAVSAHLGSFAWVRFTTNTPQNAATQCTVYASPASEAFLFAVSGSRIMKISTPVGEKTQEEAPDIAGEPSDRETAEAKIKELVKKFHLEDKFSVRRMDLSDEKKPQKEVPVLTSKADHDTRVGKRCLRGRNLPQRESKNWRRSTSWKTGIISRAPQVLTLN